MSLTFSPCPSTHCPRLPANQPKKKEGAAAVRAIARGGVSPASRILIGRVLGTGQVCAIFLTGRGVLASHFSLPVDLECTPTDQPTAFEYEHPAQANHLATRPKAPALAH